MHLFRFRTVPIQYKEDIPAKVHFAGAESPLLRNGLRDH